MCIALTRNLSFFFDRTTIDTSSFSFTRKNISKSVSYRLSNICETIAGSLTYAISLIICLQKDSWIQYQYHSLALKSYAAWTIKYGSYFWLWTVTQVILKLCLFSSLCATTTRFWTFYWRPSFPRIRFALSGCGINKSLRTFSRII